MKKIRLSALLHGFAVLLSQTIMHGIRPLLSYLECRMFCEELLENPVKLWSHIGCREFPNIDNKVL